MWNCWIVPWHANLKWISFFGILGNFWLASRWGGREGEREITTGRFLQKKKYREINNIKAHLSVHWRAQRRANLIGHVCNTSPRLNHLATCCYHRVEKKGPMNRQTLQTWTHIQVLDFHSQVEYRGQTRKSKNNWLPWSTNSTHIIGLDTDWRWTFFLEHFSLNSRRQLGAVQCGAGLCNFFLKKDYNRLKKTERSEPPGTAVAVHRGYHRRTESSVGARGATGRQVSRVAARPIPVASALSPAPKIIPPSPAYRGALAGTTLRYRRSKSSQWAASGTCRRHRGVFNGSYLEEPFRQGSTT